VMSVVYGREESSIVAIGRLKMLTGNRCSSLG
jgi:hypothetical protein